MPKATATLDGTSTRRSVPARFLDTVASRPAETSLRWHREGRWQSMRWDEYAARAACIAAGLAALGVRRGERVGILLRNRPEFHLADLGALFAGAVPVSFYNTSPPDRLAYLAAHCGATVVVVDDPAGFERFAAVRDRLPELRHIVAVDEAPPGSVPFDELQRAAPADLEEAAELIAPSDMATIIYTSGTTGMPKGAMISHANIAAAVDGALAALGRQVHGYQMISALPMAHVAERVASHYLHVSEGTCVTTCPDVALLPRYLQEVRPRAFFAVPRFWEKAAGLVVALADLDPSGRSAFDRAVALGASEGTPGAGASEGTPGAGASEGSPGAGAPDAELVRQLEEADDLLGRVRALIGLDRCEVAVATAAPTNPDVLRFFRAIGVPLSELYGLSEATGPVTWDPLHPVAGDVGTAIPGVEVRVAVDGEILVRGATVFAGYLDDPEATAAVLDDDAWLHTGDIGQLEHGRLRVVGRQKDLLVTAGGENVAPSALESLLRGHRLVSEAFVAGDRRPYLVALLTLDPEASREFAASLAPKPAGAGGRPPPGVWEDRVREELGRWIDEVNQRVSRIEQIKRFAVLDRDWELDSDELTPTMKVKRQAVLDKFADEIDRLYH